MKPTRWKKKPLTSLAALSAAVILAGTVQSVFIPLFPTAEAATQTVTPGSLNDWQFQIEGTASGMLVNGPSVPPMGSGSLRMATGPDGDSGMQFRNAAFDGTPLGDLTSLRYSTYVTDNTGCQAPYLLLNIDHDGNGSIDDLLFFEPCYQTGAYETLSGSTVPAQGTVTLDTWQEWDALNGGWWANSANTGGPPLTTLDAYVALHPDARIVNSESGSGGVRLIAGFGAPSWNDFAGYTDAVTIGVNGAEETYDFEAGALPPSGTCGDSYADRVLSFNQGNQKGGNDVAATRSLTDSILGAPDSAFTTLGFSGSIVLAFDNIIVNGSGADVRIYESTIATDYPLEQAQVRASQDGSTWTNIGTADNSDNCDCHQNTTDIDLGVLPWARYIMLTDVTDPAPHTNGADAIDINSVQALNNSCTVPGSSSSSSSSLTSSAGSMSSTGSSLSSVPGSVSSSSLSSSSVSSASSVSSTPSTGTEPSCGGMAATVYVRDGTIIGGSDDGEEYDGVLRGGNGDDVIVGTPESEEIYGRSGDDVICGGGGDDELDGGNGMDRLAGESGTDELDGGNAKDLLCGQDGDDILDAGNSQDELDGGAGTDTLDGGNSQDECRNGEDTEDCESSGSAPITACTTLLSMEVTVSSSSSAMSSSISSVASSVSSSSLSSGGTSSSLSSTSISSASSVSSTGSSLSALSSSASSETNP